MKNCNNKRLDGSGNGLCKHHEDKYAKYLKESESSSWAEFLKKTI